MAIQRRHPTNQGRGGEREEEEQCRVGGVIGDDCCSKNNGNDVLLLWLTNPSFKKNNNVDVVVVPSSRITGSNNVMKTPTTKKLPLFKKSSSLFLVLVTGVMLLLSFSIRLDFQNNGFVVLVDGTQPHYFTNKASGSATATERGGKASSTNASRSGAASATETTATSRAIPTTSSPTATTHTDTNTVDTEYATYEDDDELTETLLDDLDYSGVFFDSNKDPCLSLSDAITCGNYKCFFPHKDFVKDIAFKSRRHKQYLGAFMNLTESNTTHKTTTTTDIDNMLLLFEEDGVVQPRQQQPSGATRNRLLRRPYGYLITYVPTTEEIEHASKVLGKKNAFGTGVVSIPSLMSGYKLEQQLINEHGHKHQRDNHNDGDDGDTNDGIVPVLSMTPPIIISNLSETLAGHLYNLTSVIHKTSKRMAIVNYLRNPYINISNSNEAEIAGIIDANGDPKVKIVSTIRYPIYSQIVIQKQYTIPTPNLMLACGSAHRYTSRTLPRLLPFLYSIQGDVSKKIKFVDTLTHNIQYLQSNIFANVTYMELIIQEMEKKGHLNAATASSDNSTGTGASTTSSGASTSSSNIGGVQHPRRPTPPQLYIPKFPEYNCLRRDFQALISTSGQLYHMDYDRCYNYDGTLLQTLQFINYYNSNRTTFTAAAADNVDVDVEHFFLKKLKGYKNSVQRCNTNLNRVVKILQEELIKIKNGHNIRDSLVEFKMKFLREYPDNSQSWNSLISDAMF